MTKYWKELIIIILIATIGWLYNHPKNESIADTKNNTLKVPISSDLTVTKKANKDAPDLVVDQRYVAIINDKKVSVPVTTTKDNTTATLKQEVDVTKLITPLIPKWELGVGVGYHDSHTYVPLSVQYNYTYKRGVQVEGHIGTDGQFKGAEIQHKWKF